jgi:hypothetical protein
MCLITKTKKVKVLKRDLPVWKLLGPNNESLVQKYPYKEGKIHTAKMTKLPNDSRNWKAADGTASEGLDKLYPSWRNLGEDIWFEEARERDNAMCIQKGLHAYTTRRRASGMKKDIAENFWLSITYETVNVVKFIIPEGAEYYKDEFGCIISNKIKLA